MSKRKITPILVDSNPTPPKHKFGEEKKSTKLVPGSDAWQKKKEKDSRTYLQDMERRIKKGEGMYGEKKYKKVFKTKSKKKRTSRKKNVKSDVPFWASKGGLSFWKSKGGLPKTKISGSSACRPNEIRVKAHCRKSGR